MMRTQGLTEPEPPPTTPPAPVVAVVVVVALAEPDPEPVEEAVRAEVAWPRVELLPLAVLEAVAGNRVSCNSLTRNKEFYSPAWAQTEVPKEMTELMSPELPLQAALLQSRIP